MGEGAEQLGIMSEKAFEGKIMKKKGWETLLYIM